MFITLLPINFNSSQVRLEHNGGIYAGNNNAFQFQLGTIGTDLESMSFLINATLPNFNSS